MLSWFLLYFHPHPQDTWPCNRHPLELPGKPLQQNNDISFSRWLPSFHSTSVPLILWSFGSVYWTRHYGLHFWAFFFGTQVPSGRSLSKSQQVPGWGGWPSSGIPFKQSSLSAHLPSPSEAAVVVTVMEKAMNKIANDTMRNVFILVSRPLGCSQVTLSLFFDPMEERRNLSCSVVLFIQNGRL